MAVLQHTGWAVTSVDANAYTVSASGDAVYGARVHFQTNAGNAGSVFVADDQLSPDNVTYQINQRAAVMDSVANLQMPAGGVEV